MHTGCSVSPARTLALRVGTGPAAPRTGGRPTRDRTFRAIPSTGAVGRINERKAHGWAVLCFDIDRVQVGSRSVVIPDRVEGERIRVCCGVAYCQIGERVVDTHVIERITPLLEGRRSRPYKGRDYEYQERRTSFHNSPHRRQRGAFGYKHLAHAHVKTKMRVRDNRTTAEWFFCTSPSACAPEAGGNPLRCRLRTRHNVAPAPQNKSIRFCPNVQSLIHSDH